MSGGLDSTTVLYAAIEQGYAVYPLTLSYGQLHVKEIECAKAIAEKLKVSHQILEVSLPWKGSSLLDASIPIPSDRNEKQMAQGIPSTYVPARNTIFLAYAASYAEALNAEAIFIGANVLDYSGYPDCRPDFFDAFRAVIAKGTKIGTEGKSPKILAPLLNLGKKEIVLLGNRLNVPFHLTWSCYRGEEIPCGACDSCKLRAKGFREAKIQDPITSFYEISGHTKRS